MGHNFTNHLPLALLIGLAISLVLVSMVLFTRSFVTASSDLEQPLTSNPIPAKPNKPTPTPATVDWGDVTNKPTGFADDLDNDALAALNCNTDQLARWNGSAWECFSQGPTITRFHAPGENGRRTSIVIGSDGLPLVGFKDKAANYVKVAHCENVSCTAATIATIDDTAFQAHSTSIMIGTDGLPLITYFKRGEPDGEPLLIAAHCGDVACQSVTLNQLDTMTSLDVLPSITMGADGLGLISYGDPSIGLKVAHCDTIICDSATISVIDTGPIDRATTITTDSEGLALIYYASPQTIKIAHCLDVNCTFASITEVISPAFFPIGRMAIGSDGFPIMVHGDFLNVVHCDDIDCTATTSSTLFSGTRTVHPFITIGLDGLPVISFGLSSHLALAHCVDLICSDAVLTLVDDWDKVGEYNSVTIGQDGLPIIAYYDEMFQDLKVAHCPDPSCGPKQR